MRRVVSVVTVLFVGPACTHTLPIRLVGDSGLAVGDAQQFALESPSGQAVVVQGDTRLELDLRGGKRLVFQDGARLRHVNQIVRVEQFLEEHQYPDADIEAMRVVSYDRVATGVAIGVGSALLLGGVIALVYGFSAIASGDP